MLILSDLTALPLLSEHPQSSVEKANVNTNKKEKSFFINTPIIILKILKHYPKIVLPENSQ